MKIAILGTGYVGLTTGACFASLGNTVVCVDIDAAKIQQLQHYVVPFFEPGLAEMVKLNAEQGRLSFTTDAQRAIQAAEIVFIAVGTPSGNNGNADLSHVFAAAETIGKCMQNEKVIVIKSTVPIGTARKVENIIRQHQPHSIPFALASNPEFLREGEAINDFLSPDRIIIGTDDDKAKEVLLRLYKPIERAGKPIIITSLESALLIKYASNAMLASRISFMNELACLCEKVGADIKDIAKGMGFDQRIGSRFLQAGVGYGGSCFPKDVKALAATLQDYGCNAELLQAVDAVNERQKRSVVPRLKEHLALKGKKIALWGLSFKPKTDDLREATSAIVIQQLLEEGASVMAFDPAAMPAAKKQFSISFSEVPYEAAKGASAVVLLTEWDVFRELDFERVKKDMKQPVILDGRNIYDPGEFRKLGFTYIGVGR